MGVELNPKFVLEVGNGFREKVALLKPLKEHFGQAMLEVVRAAVARQTRTLWAGLAAQEPDNRPDTLVDLLWNRLCTPLGGRHPTALHPLPDPRPGSGAGRPGVGLRAALRPGPGHHRRLQPGHWLPANEVAHARRRLLRPLLLPPVTHPRVDVVGPVFLVSA